MECFEVETRIISYLDHNLDEQELGEFLEHLETCEDCRKEVELYFTLFEGLNQMDEDEIQFFDFQTEFDQMRERQSEELRLRKCYRKLIDRLVIAFVVIMILVGLVYGLFHMNDYDKKYIAQEAYYEQQISLD
jgi:predicted anti-sigma-YlaC factor YlaD